MLSGDRPIEDASDDVLARGGFANQIRFEIENAPRQDGLVLAVTGPWGSGKTSVINLAVGPLRQRPGYRLVDFNPWLFSGTPQLVEHFFAQLTAEFAGSGDRRLVRIGKALERYGDRIDPLRFVPGVGMGADLGRAVGRFLKGPADVGVRAHRDKLNGLLREHDELLVVVVDDIDRLRDDEIADVMRLVRLVADFPNTVYVLAFDLNRVAAAVASDASDGMEYIEKIVQVAHEVPAVAPESLTELLVQRLSRALEGIEYRLDREAWQTVFPIVRPWFTTTRDVVRFCNHVRGPIGLLGREVEAADVLALECMRMFARHTWGLLVPTAEALTAFHDPNLAGLHRGQEARHKRQVEELLVDAADVELLEELLIALFPAGGRHLGATTYSSTFGSGWRRDRRVADLEVLRTYLSRQVQPGRVPTHIVEQVIATMEEPTRMRELLRPLTGVELRSLMARLEEHEGQFPADVGGAVAELYAVEDRLSDEHGMFAMRRAIVVSRVVLRILRTLPADAILATVDRALPSIPSLSHREDLIGLIGHTPGGGHRLVPENQAREREQSLVEEILSAPAVALAAEDDLAMLLHLAEKHEPDRTVALVRDYAVDDAFLVALIASCRIEMHNAVGRHLMLKLGQSGCVAGRRPAHRPRHPA